MVAKVTPISEYLWRIGDPYDAVEQVHIFLCEVFGKDLFLQAAQLDVCVDVVGFTLPTEWERVFISKAIRKKPIGDSQKDQAVYHGRTLETINLSGHGRPISCKMYNKTTEIVRKSPDKVWFYPLWQAWGWNYEAWMQTYQNNKHKANKLKNAWDVWRVEFSFEREGLHEMDLEDIYTAIQQIRAIWAYCTHEWLRMVVPKRAQANRTRWPLHPAWRTIQHAFDRYGPREPVGAIVREPKHLENMDRAIAAMAGYATTYWAWEKELLTEADDPDTMFSIVYDKIKMRWEELNIRPNEVVRQKKFLYHRKA